MQNLNFLENYKTYFSIHYKNIFEVLSNAAMVNNFKIYLIGGLVRDMLLDISSRDIDIAIEGNAIEFARILQAQYNAKILSIHKDFGTAKILLNQEKIDIASTRSETYPYAGQLPQVLKLGCSLNEDIKRRDFTINALAISLNKNNFADLIDFVNGYQDLQNKAISILHEKSFIDDPTRIIRALKYSSRLNFELDKKTLALQYKYLDNVNYNMCYKRIKQEFKKTFNSNLKNAFERFINQKIYKLLTTKEVYINNIDEIENLILEYKPNSPWLIYLGLVTEDFEKLELTKSEKYILESFKELKSITFRTDFEIYKAYKTVSIETLILLICTDKKEIVLHYLRDLKNIKLEITGQDLIKTGMPASKQIGLALDFVLKQKLATPNLTKVEELGIAKQYINKSTKNASN